MARRGASSELNPEVVREYIEEESGLSFRGNGASWIFTCPRCSKNDKLWIRKRDGRWICWFCAEISGYRGNDPSYVLADLTGEKVADIRVRLYGADLGGVEQLLSKPAPGFYSDPEEFEQEEDFGPDPIDWPYNYFSLDHKKGARGLAYLESRGIPPDIAQAYGIRYAPEDRRVAFPVQSDGLLYGYQGRLVIPATGTTADGLDYEIPKILSSNDLPREHMLMFSDRLKGSEHAVLTEGPIDGIMCHECGGNVAAMGKAVTRGQIRVIRDAKVKKLYLGLDPDAAEETMRLVRDTSGDMEVYSMMATGSGDKPDLGAMSFSDNLALFRAAPRVDSRRLFFFFRPL